MYILVYWMAGSEEEACTISQDLVKKKLAGCVNLIPKVTSIYFWEGKVHKDEEVKVIIKTHKSKFGALKEYIQKKSSYEVPEIISVSIDEGSKEYLKWLQECIPLVIQELAF